MERQYFSVKLFSPDHSHFVNGIECHKVLANMQKQQMYSHEIELLELFRLISTYKQTRKNFKKN